MVVLMVLGLATPLFAADVKNYTVVCEECRKCSSQFVGDAGQEALEGSLSTESDKKEETKPSGVTADKKDGKKESK